MTVLVTNTPATAANPTLQTDRILEGDSDGTLALYHLASDLSWASQASPNDEDPLVDLSANANDGRVNIASGGPIVFTGGGFYFGDAVATNNYMECPAAVAADIWASDDQYFMVDFWAKLPDSNDFNKQGTIAPFIHWSSSILGWTAGVDLVTIAQRYNTTTGLNALVARRQTNGSTATDNLDLTMNAADFGQIAQVAFWRNAAGQALRLRTANGARKVTTAVGADNTGNFSARPGRFGLGPSWWNFSLGNHILAADWTGYRLHIENLETSGRDPETVLDADWYRHNGRFT